MPWSTPSHKGVPLADSVEVTKSILRSASEASAAGAVLDDAGTWAAGTAAAWAGGTSRVGGELVQASSTMSRIPGQERAARCMAASFRDSPCGGDCPAAPCPLGG